MRFLRLIRWINLVLILIAVVLGIRFNGYGFEFLPTIYLAMSASLVLCGANAINNALDSNRDSPSKRNPVADGSLSKSTAITIGLVLTIGGIIISSLLGRWFLISATATSFLLFLYNRYLKDRLIIGNLVVAGISGFLFIYIGWFFGLDEKFVIASIFAFFTHLAREIVKDIEDIEEDQRAGSKTLPIVFGKRISSLISSIILIIVGLGLPAPFLLGIFGWGYLIFALAGVLPLIIVVVWQLAITKYQLSQKLIKVLMLIGIIALFWG